MSIASALLGGGLDVESIRLREDQTQFASFFQVKWIKRDRSMEREKGIEPSPQAWEARVLPLNYSRSRETT